jgi:hypothetical protein
MKLIIAYELPATLFCRSADDLKTQFAEALRLLLNEC